MKAGEVEETKAKLGHLPLFPGSCHHWRIYKVRNCEDVCNREKVGLIKRKPYTTASKDFE